LAISSPIFLPAPVTIATWSLSFISFVLLFAAP
jgi:hypothetical protein